MSRKAQVGSRYWQGCWRSRRGIAAQHGRKWKRYGTWEIHRGLGGRDTKYVNARGTSKGKADAAMEVGPTDSTQRAGKPRTRGSGGQDEFLK